MYTEIITLTIVLFLSAFFSSSEIALISLSRLKIRHLVDQKRKGSIILKKIRESPHQLLINIAIANNVVNIFGASFATAIAIEMFGNSGVGIATGIMTFLILTFGEIIPKTIATKHAEKIALMAARPIYIIGIILKPLINLFEGITKAVMREKNIPKITEDEIKTLVTMGEEEGAIEKIEKEMIHNIFTFNDIHAWEVMTPRTKVISLEVNSKLNEIKKTIKESGFSRIPIYEENKDNIIGLLYIKDLISYLNTKRKINLKKIARKTLFIPRNKRIDLLLKEFQNKKMHMAMVVNEHGGIEGVVTLEDLLEEITGEIYDETDKEEKPIKRIEPRTYLIKGNTELDLINEQLKLDLEEREDSNTISGLILDRLGRIPKKKDKLKIKDIEIIITKVDMQRIEEIKLIKK
jgi:putative hemolysin